VLTTTLLFLSFFVSFVFLSVGVFGSYRFNSVLVSIAGFLLIFAGIAAGAGGVIEYDGSYNSTYSYHNTTNVTVNTIARVANYAVHKTDNTFTAFYLILIGIGIALLIYGAMLYAKPSEVAS